MASHEGMIHFSTEVGHEGGFLKFTSPTGDENTLRAARVGRARLWPITRSTYDLTHNGIVIEQGAKARSTITALRRVYRKSIK